MNILVQFSRLVLSDSLRPHGLQHAGFPVHHQLQGYLSYFLYFESVWKFYQKCFSLNNNNFMVVELIYNKLHLFQVCHLVSLAYVYIFESLSQ